MIIACPQEIKTHEYRIGLAPSCAAAYTREGHRVLIEAEVGAGAGFANDAYQGVGVEVIGDRSGLFRVRHALRANQPLARFARNEDSGYAIRQRLLPQLTDTGRGTWMTAFEAIE